MSVFALFGGGGCCNGRNHFRGHGRGYRRFRRDRYRRWFRY
ncbi:hypothetical protein [Peterkaempfera griseoplana]|nr:hypothetical protein [Peterkaempfera griseoplana]